MSSHTSSRPQRGLELPDPLSRVEEEQEGYLARCDAQFQNMVRHREAQAVLVALAAGVGVGLLLAGSFGGGRRQRGFWDQHTAEGLGRRLLDRIDQILPDAITERFHS